MDYEEYKRKALEPIVNYIESAMASYSKEEIEARIKKALPEKERDDERIRKGLVKMISNIDGGHPFENYGIIKKEALTYLEKQKDEAQKQFNLGVQAGREEVLYEMEKEQKPLMSDGELEDRKRDIVAAIRKHYSADYAEYLTSFLKGLSLEDNSEDEYGQKMLGIAYKLMYEHIPENLRTQEYWDSLKFMREYTGKVAIIHSYEQQPAEQLGGTFTSYDMAKTFTEGQNYVIAHPEKFGLCKPAEWSEEDKRRLEQAINALGRNGYYVLVDWLQSLPERFNIQSKQEWSEEDEAAFGDLMWCIEQARKSAKDENDMGNVWFAENWVKNRLESLRPQPNWKPSDIQMAALNYARTYITDDEGSLSSLYKDLKKLMR